MKKMFIPFKKVKDKNIQTKTVLFLMRLWIILFVLSVILIVYLEYKKA